MPQAEAIYNKTVDPTVDDDSLVNVRIGDDWRNTVTQKVYECTDNTVGAAKWFNTTEQVDGSRTVYNGTIAFNADALLSPPALVANVDNYDPLGWRNVDGNVVKSVLRMLTDGVNRRVSGLVAPVNLDGSIVTITNIGVAGSVVLRNNDPLSLATNRFILNNNTVLAPNETTTVWYDVISQRWRLYGDYK